jgi:2-succinyl-5-enolpyruvyl-6-hydroxy-3-cyclohexene-1-carboxylate synthase
MPSSWSFATARAAKCDPSARPRAPPRRGFVRKLVYARRVLVRVRRRGGAAGGARGSGAGRAGLQDPAAAATHVVAGGAADFARALAAACPARSPGGAPAPPLAPSALLSLAAASEAVCAAQRAALAAAERAGELTEPLVAVRTAAAVPRGAGFFLSSSMPIRDADMFLSPGACAAGAVGANRGASGIDGVLSSALGSAPAPPPSY